MSTQKQAEASRANGAKSKGPQSEQSREKSAKNAVQHGLTSTHNILLAGEDPARFQEMCAEYEQAYHPNGAVENHLVQDMVAARWRIRRLWNIEARLLDEEMASHDAGLAAQRPDLDGATHLALAFRRLADESRSFALISRYESRLQRQHERAVRTLRDLQSARQPKQAAPEVPPAVVAPPELKKCESNPAPPAQPPVAAPSRSPKTGPYAVDRSQQATPRRKAS